VHLMSSGIRNSAYQTFLSGNMSLDYCNDKCPELHKYPYPAHLGTDTLERWSDTWHGHDEDLLDSDIANSHFYEFCGVYPSSFVALRSQWHEYEVHLLQTSTTNVPSSRGYSDLVSPRRVLTQRSSGDTSSMPESERLFLGEIEVPADWGEEELYRFISEKWDTGGKSGAPLYFSRNSQLLFKMMDDEEFEFLSTLVIQYKDYCISNPNSLLLRIAGLYQIRMRPVQNLFSFIVMYNAAPFNGVFCKYDLKGSTSGRRERPKETELLPFDSDNGDSDEVEDMHMWKEQWAGEGTLLDLDFIQDIEAGRVVELSLTDKQKLMHQLANDVEFLASQHVMDYSLLLSRGEYDGQNLPAGFHELHVMASSSRSRECYYFSLIDISQKYTMKKAAEHFAKVHILRRGDYQVSSTSPGRYAKRFLERLNMYMEPELPSTDPFIQRLDSTDWKRYD